MADDTGATEQLRAEAAQTRLRSIQSQLGIGFTFCRIVETEIREGKIDEARKLIQKTRRAAQLIRGHLDEPDHVPPDQVNAAREVLRKLEARIADVTARLPGTAKDK
jgi:hypothetical protein